ERDCTGQSAVVRKLGVVIRQLSVRDAEHPSAAVAERTAIHQQRGGTREQSRFAWPIKRRLQQLDAASVGWQQREDGLRRGDVEERRVLVLRNARSFGRVRGCSASRVEKLKSAITTFSRRIRARGARIAG